MADKFTVNLYDANGGFVGTALHDEDPGQNRDRPLHVNGKTYLYQARQDRWVEAGEPMNVSSKVQQPEAHVVTDTPERKS